MASDVPTSRCGLTPCDSRAQDEEGCLQAAAVVALDALLAEPGEADAV